MAKARDFVTIPFEAYFGKGAILRDYSPWYEYDEVIVNGKKESVKMEKPSGMKAVVVSPSMAFEHVTVKIKGDDGKSLDISDLTETFQSSKHIYVGFDNFAGSQYTRDNVTHYTGKATRIYRLQQEKPTDGAVPSQGRIRINNQ